MAKSASNVAERKPVTARKGVPAPAKAGSAGAALAEIFYQFEEKRASHILGEQKSMKDRLLEIAGLSSMADHQAFRETLAVHVKAINDEAAKAKLTVTQYREVNPVADHIAVTMSLWSKMSRACEVGWPAATMMEKSWAEISKSATAFLDSHAATLEQKRLNEEAAKVQASNKPEAVKKAEVAVINAKMEAVAVKAAANKSGTSTAAAKKSNYDQAVAMLSQFPLEDLQAVAAWLQTTLAEKSKPAQRIVAKAPKGSGQPMPEPAAETARKAAVPSTPKEEKAQANGGKRGRK